MSAKEMFEGLGYKQCWNKDHIIMYEFEEFYSFPNKNIVIEFDSNRKVFKVFANAMGIDTKTLQAINKQVEELSWNK